MKNENYEVTKYKGYSKYLISQECTFPIKGNDLTFYEGEIIFLKKLKDNYFIFYRPYGPALIDMDKNLIWYSNGFNARNNGPSHILNNEIRYWESYDIRKNRIFIFDKKEETYWNY